MHRTFACLSPLFALLLCAKDAEPFPTKTAVSRDGTSIAFSHAGHGPAVVIVDGALCYHGFGPSEPLARLLTQNFTVFIYDRRGRGNSTNTPPYAVEREIEDIAALIKEAGGSAYLYGISSGAILSIEAAVRLPGIKKVAVYEPPFILDSTHPPLPPNYMEHLNELLAANRRDDAVKLFMKTMEVPDLFVRVMPLMPSWRNLIGVAHTIPYDIAIVRDYQRGKPLNTDRWASVKIPMLFMAGSKSPVWIQHSARAATRRFANAQTLTLDGADHDPKPNAVNPVLTKFFGQ